MKKVFALLLTVVLLVSVLAACSNPLDDLSKKIQDLTNETTTTTEEPTTTTTTEEPTTTTEWTTTTTEEPTTGETGEGVDAEYDQVVYDEGGILIEAVGTTWDDYYCNVELYIENNTDANLTFTCGTSAVEGIIVDGWLYEKLDAGSKTYTDFEFYSDEMLNYGLTDPSWIMFALEVYDSDSYSSDGYPDDYVCNIYPYGEDEAYYHPYTATDDDLVVVDNDDIAIYIYSYEITDDGDFILNCVLDNKTDSIIIFSEEDSSINGFDVDAWAYQTMLPYSICELEVEYEADDLEDQHIDASEITEGTVGFNVYDNEYNTIWEGTYDYTLN